MPARPVGQLGLDEETVDDKVVEKALEERQRAKEALDPYQREYREAHDAAKDAIKRLELPDGGAVRVGRFRVTKTFRPARSVTFETGSRSDVRIGLADDED